MNDNWNSYFCEVDGKVASIFLDLGLRGAAPAKRKPWLLWVRTYLMIPRADGLPSSDDQFQLLHSVEDKLVGAVSAACKAVFSGRITTDGRREFYFYAQGQNNFQAAVEGTMDAFPEYKFEVGAEPDPDWSHYLNVLYPSDEDMQRIKNRGVLEVLEQKGDNPAITRDVWHWLYFRSAADRRLAASKAGALGYTVDGTSKDSKYPLPFGLTLKRKQEATPEAIDDAVIELFRLAKEAGAEYDGWDTSVER